MTPEEAIRLNGDLLRTGNYDVDPKFTKALRLGIESLKFFKDLKDRGALPSDVKLSGETE